MAIPSIVVAANFTAEPIGETLEFWTSRLAMPFVIRFAPFDQIFQQLLGPDSLLARNTGGMNVVLLKIDAWVSRDPLAVAEGSDQPFERKINEFIAAMRALFSRSPVPCILALCPASPERLADVSIARALQGAEARIVAALAVTPGAHFITEAEIARYYPVAVSYDAASAAVGAIPYTEDFFVALGTMLVRRLRVLADAPYKMIVVDCDNTLWGGVLGEVGPDGIFLEAPHIALQDFLLEQQSAGVLVALCSKNDDGAVVAAFSCRNDFPLRLEHVAGRRINWEPKSANIRSLARELNLGLDSFIFIDDSPYEIAEVRANCPEVLALHFPGNVAGVRRLIEHCWAFDRGVATREDRARAASYHENAARAEALQQAGSLDDFLRTLELEVRIAVPGPEDAPRVAQMTQRTNQFNTSTIRRTEAEVTSPGTLDYRIVRVRDRFGDYGTVGLMVFEVAGNVLRADTLLLSCRALGRKVEHHMLVELGRIARAGGATIIEIPFVRTARNTPALTFLNALATTPHAVEADHVFRISPARALDAMTIPCTIPVDTPVGGDPAPGKIGSPGRAMPESFESILAGLSTTSAIRDAIEATNQRARPAGVAGLVPPRTSRERQIAAIWKRVLRLDEVGVRDNFFDLGGTSVAAVPLFVRLGRAVGAKLDPHLLFEAPTIEELARLVDDLAAASARSSGELMSLVAIQPRGSRPPLFLIHAGAGSILFYYPLATALGSEQPVYGLQARGINGRSLADASVEVMASHYLAEMRSVQPKGPYHLGGFCFGATIAFEMAQQLERTGESVALLCSLDGVAPRFNDPGGRARGNQQFVPKRENLPPWTRPLPAELARGVLYHLDTLRTLGWRQRATYLPRKLAGYVRRTSQRWLIRSLRWYTARSGGAVPSVFRKFRWYFTVNNLLARTRYAPASYTGDIAVVTLKGRYRDPGLGWSRWVVGSVTSVEIDATFRFHRDLLAQHAVKAVGAAVTKLLAAADKGDPAGDVPAGA